MVLSPHYNLEQEIAIKSVRVGDARFIRVAFFIAH